MTFEHKIVVGVGDIKAVTFECNACKSRTTIPVEKLQGIPSACSLCPAVWHIKDPSKSVSASGPAELAFIQSIVTIRTLIREKKDTVTILLEFEAPHAN